MHKKSPTEEEVHWRAWWGL